MTAAPKDTILTVSTIDEPYVQQTEPPVVVRVCAPFQVYFDRVVFTAGETVALPADVAARYTLAGWVTPAP